MAKPLGILYGTNVRLSIYECLYNLLILCGLFIFSTWNWGVTKRSCRMFQPKVLNPMEFVRKLIYWLCTICHNSFFHVGILGFFLFFYFLLDTKCIDALWLIFYKFIYDKLENSCFDRLQDLMDFLQPQQDVLFSLYTRQQFLILQRGLGSRMLSILMFSYTYIYL